MGEVTEKLNNWISLYLNPALVAFNEFMDTNKARHSSSKDSKEEISKELIQTYELLLNAIKEIRKVFEEHQSTNSLEELLNDSKSNFDETCKAYKLTDREIEVIELIAAGKSNKAIAKELFISERTVHTHISAIFKKVDVNKRITLLKRLGLDIR